MIGVIFGPPGSGKGTQAALLHDRFNLVHLSTGEILRHEVARGSELGREVGRIMQAGQLVPDDLVDRVVQEHLRQVEGDVLLDGFPRTVEQAKALDEMLADADRHVDFVIALEAPEKLLVERLLHRAQVEGRADDTRQAIEERMHEYRTRTAAVLDHYRSTGVPVFEVDAEGSVDAVFERVRASVSQATARPL
ncbi:MAG: adenylate kinase [Chloroflexi bacterium]|nr:MAG: adenylate kinase [Chloroflexota bacterium]